MGVIVYSYFVVHFCAKKTFVNVSGCNTKYTPGFEARAGLFFYSLFFTNASYARFFFTTANYAKTLPSVLRHTGRSGCNSTYSSFSVHFCELCPELFFLRSPCLFLFASHDWFVYNLLF